MRRAISTTCLLGVFSLLSLQCASGDPGEPSDFEDEGVGSIRQEASKCIGGRVGDSNYCTAACKCDLGEGDCDNATECNVHPTLGQLQCTGQTIYFGHARNSNACAPLHCGNKKLDGNETQIDCGGDCGTTCPNACANIGPNGSGTHCTAQCRCAVGHGDCANNNALCAVGNVCRPDVGINFGFAANVDVCLASHCVNGMQDGDEIGQDCGPSCVPCSGGSQLSFAKGGAAGDHGLDVAIDNSSAIVVAGRFGGTASFGGASLTADGGADIYVARYNNAGTHAWSKRFGGSAADGDLGVSVAVDNGRNIYVAGNYRGTIDFGGVGFTHTAVGTTDAFIVKFNQSGTPLWSRSYGGPSATRFHNLAVSSAGDVFAAGSFASASISFGGAARTNAGAAGTYDAVLLRLTSAGAYVYDQTFGSTGADHATDVAIDPSLNAYVSGQFQNTVLGMTSANANPDAFLAGFSSGGANTFANAIGGTLDDAGLAAAFDSVGPVLTGRFRSTATFGATAVAATGNNSGFAIAYTTAGAYRWHKTFLPATGGAPASTAMGGTGGLVVGGSFSGATDFGSGMATAVQGGRDIYLIRYNTAGTIVWSDTFAATTATLLGATQSSGMLGVVGNFQGTINFGGSDLTSNGDDDMFFARFAF